MPHLITVWFLVSAVAPAPAAEMQNGVAENMSHLSDADPAAREHAAWGLGKWCGLKSMDPNEPAVQRAVSALAGALTDPDASVRIAAAGSLRLIGSNARSAAPMLLIAFKDRDLGVRISALSALASIKPDSKDAALAVQKLVTDEHPVIREQALTALASLRGDQAAPFLFVGLRDSGDAKVRCKAAELVGRMRRPTREAVGALVETLDDPMDFVQEAAADALAQMAANSKEAVQRAIPVLRDKWSAPAKSVEQRSVKVSVAKTLALLDNSDAAIARLSECLGDANAGVREKAARAFADLGPVANRAVPKLIRLLGDQREDLMVRVSAAQALGTISPHSSEALTALRAASTDSDWWLGDTAKTILKGIDPANEPPPK